MATRRARVRRALPGTVPALFVLGLEVILLVAVIGWRQQQQNLCHAAKFARTSNNVTLREPFRRFALDAATARQSSADREIGEQRLIDLTAAARYRAIAARIKDLPDIKC